jgi:cAMP-dependent protein kinase regulator
VGELAKMAVSSEARGKRASVSAEVFGTWNRQETFKPPRYEKSAEVMAALKSRLQQAFIFNSLNPDELKIIMLAFRAVTCKAGDVVITEGENGEDLYCVQAGKLTCTKKTVSYLPY